MSQLEIFDYSQLSTEMASEVRAASERIKLRLRRSAEDIIAIGQDLITAKEKLGHGNFRKWVGSEFNMSQAAASRFMSVAEKFGSKMLNLSNLTPSVLYELAAPSTPEPVRQQAIAKVENGENVAVKEVQEWKRKAKASEKREREAQQRLDEANQQAIAAESRLKELVTQLSELKAAKQQVEAEKDRLASQEPEVVERVVEKIPEGYSSLEEAIALQESRLAELRAEADKEAKRFKQRKTAHENRLQGLSQEIADKDPIAEAVRTARFHATQYKELTSKYIEQLLAIGFEAWIEGEIVAPSDALKEIDETSKWLIGRIDRYLAKVADKSGRRDISANEIDVITVEATRF